MGNEIKMQKSITFLYTKNEHVETNEKLNAYTSALKKRNIYCTQNRTHTHTHMHIHIYMQCEI